MKKYLLILILFTACKTKHKQIEKPVPQVCTFGVDTTQMVALYRQLPTEEIEAVAKGRKPKPPPISPPQPTGTGIATFLLEFNGDTITNTSWNYGPYTTLVLGKADLTVNEQQTVIDQVWQHYKQFGYIQFTLDKSAYNAANPLKRRKIIFTDSSDWFGRSGGVSFVGSLFWSTEEPAFVFTALLNYNVHAIGEAGAHEIGHCIGLYHQSIWDASCVKLSEYRPGVLMGSSYSVPLGPWINGTNSRSCTTMQNDSLFINSKK